MGRSAHDNARCGVDHGRMEAHGQLHRIEVDLDEGWIDDSFAHGLAALEDYLQKHLAFLTYLDDLTAPERPSASPLG
jgi:hypothetical protein